MTSIRILVDPIQSLGSGAIGAAYMGLGPVFDESARMILIANYTDGLMMFSWDGVNDHFPLPLYTSLLLTISQNDEENADYFALPALSRIYVRQISAPTTGSVYVTHFRGINDA